VDTDNNGDPGFGFRGSLAPKISDDGRYVVFESDAYNLVANDTNGNDIFVKDLVSGAIFRVSTDSFAAQADGQSYAPDICADGRYVTFYSDADNLVADDTNGVADIFVKDLFSGSIARVSVSSDGQQSNGRSYDPCVSSDGQYITFYSYATNLHPWDTSTTADVYRVSNPLANHTPLAASLSNTTVAENSAAGTMVGTLRTTDIDAGDTFVYTLLDDAGGRFVLDGDQVSVADGALLDYETAARYTIRVRTTDLGGAGLSYEQELDITITDVHEFDSPGLFDPTASCFYLRASNTSGAADYAFGYGVPDGGWTVIEGDWDGDGRTGVGLYDPQTSTFYLSNAYQTGVAEYTFGYGVPGGGWTPLVGDWNGDGAAGVGLYDPQSSTFYLTDTLRTGVAEYTFGYGAPGGGWTPLVGDWDGDGRTGVGLYDAASSTFYLTSRLETGCAEYTFGYGVPHAGWQTLVGDWDGDGTDGVGLFAPRSSTFYLTNTFADGSALYTFVYGQPSVGWQTLVGDWNGDGAAGVGLYAPQTSTFYLTNALSTGTADYTVEFGPARSGWQPLVGCWGDALDAAAVDLLLS
jgi:hypothetical protein